MSDIVRVLRLVEYVGPRELVEKQVELSIHGTKRVLLRDGSGIKISAVTLNEYPEVLDNLPATKDWSTHIEDISDQA